MGYPAEFACAEILFGAALAICSGWLTRNILDDRLQRLARIGLFILGFMMVIVGFLCFPALEQMPAS